MEPVIIWYISTALTDIVRKFTVALCGDVLRRFPFQTSTVYDYPRKRWFISLWNIICETDRRIQTPPKANRQQSF